MHIKPLLKRNPLLLLLGQLVSAMGSMMQSFALSLYVLDKTGSGTKFASVIAMAIIPRIILGPVAGIITDRISRKKMIVILDFASFLVTIGFAAVYFFTGSLTLPMIYVLVFTLTTISVFFDSPVQAMIPDIIDKEYLVDANSASRLIFSVVSVTSPIVAGLLYGKLGLLAILVANGISFLLSSISETFIHIEKESLQKDKSESFMKSFKDGWNFLRQAQVLLMIMGVALVANFALSPIFGIGLPYMLREDLQVSETLYGICLSIMTVGSMLGAILASVLCKKYSFDKLLSYILAFCGIIAAIIAVVMLPSISLGTSLVKVFTVVGLVLIVMLATTIASIALGATMQRLVPGHLLGRVSGVLSTIAMAAMPVGQMLYGSALDIMPSFGITFIYAMIVVASGILSFIGFGRLRKKGKLDIVTNPQERLEYVE